MLRTQYCGQQREFSARCRAQEKRRNQYPSRIIDYQPDGVNVTNNLLRYSTEEARITRLSQVKGIARRTTITKLDNLIQRHYGKQYKLRPFGSTCYGAGRADSDLDLCIFDLNRPYGLPPYTSLSDLPPIYDVRSIADLLNRAGYSEVSYRDTAAVSIVKLTDPQTMLSCDINVNHRLGWYNTDLFRQYCLLFNPLAPLLRRVKDWARHVGLNSPSTPGVPTSFSSYSLTLMTIAWLQSVGYLPNLQADKTKFVNTYFWSSTKLGRPQKVKIQYGLCDEWTSPCNYVLADCLRAWFCYFGHEHEYRSTSTVLSIRDGGLIDWGAATNVPTGSALHGSHINYANPKAYKLVVLDPFLSKNCTGRIRSKTLKRFQRACQEQYAKLDGVSSKWLREHWDELLIPPLGSAPS